MSDVSTKVYGTVMGVLFAVSGASNADEMPVSMQQHSIGYVTTDLHWALYQTSNVNADCPEGLNGNGPRETFRALYPNGGPVETTQLARESLKIFPEDKGPQFPYILAKGSTAIGLNLDGREDTGFTSPTGEKGIDNNLFKVIGCNAQYRTPDGQMQLFSNKLIHNFNFDRIMIELNNVDNLTNADDVDVTIYRGRDPLLLDATGETVAPGGSQRVDMHYGRKLIQHLHGKIINGVLTTEPVDAQWPWANYFDTPSVLHIRDMRLRLNVTGAGANGLIAGYVDVSSFYHWVTSWSTHHLSYGRLDPAEFYWAVKNNADAYPDKDGKMTAISSALTINMAQVFIQHPPGEHNDRQITADASSGAR